MISLLPLDVRLVVCRVTGPGFGGSEWTWRAIDAEGGVTESPRRRSTPEAVLAFLAEVFPFAAVSIDDPWAS